MLLESLKDSIQASGDMSKRVGQASGDMPGQLGLCSYLEHIHVDLHQYYSYC